MSDGVSAQLTATELADLDAAIVGASAAGDLGGLPVMGFGEISLAVAWPPGDGRVVAKTAPCLPEPAAVERYAALLGEYAARLADLGVATVPTEVRTGPSGNAYLLQPRLPAATLADELLRRDPGRADEVLTTVVAAVARVLPDRAGATVGLDAHVANWVVAVDGTLTLLDLGSPFLRTDDGRDELDLSYYLAVMPAVLRPAVARLSTGIVAPYFERRGVLRDLGLNLQRADLAMLRPRFVELANDQLDEPLTVKELASAYVRDARQWQVLQALRRVDRRWQRHVRRRAGIGIVPPRQDRHL